MCNCCCLKKTCCCERSLQDGTLSWAVLDLVFHIFLFPLPFLALLFTYVAPAAEILLILVVFSDVALIIGSKSGWPGFLTPWLIIRLIDILILFALWGVIGGTYYLVWIGETMPTVRITSVEYITENTYAMVIATICLVFLVVCPFFYIYFWMVVWSLRKRWLMEIAIGYNENVRVVSREEAQNEMALAVVAQQKLRHFNQV